MASTRSPGRGPSGVASPLGAICMGTRAFVLVGPPLLEEEAGVSTAWKRQKRYVAFSCSCRNVSNFPKRSQFVLSSWILKLVLAVDPKAGPIARIDCCPSSLACHRSADQTVKEVTLQLAPTWCHQVWSVHACHAWPKYFAFHLVPRIGTMYLDDDCFHSKIACGPDSLEPKLEAKLVGVKSSTCMGDATQYVLQCALATTDLKWSVERRYSEFRELMKKLHAFFLCRGGGARPQCFGCAWFAQTLRRYLFPRRHLLNSRSPDVINQRRVRLHQFVLIVTSHTFSAVPKCIACAKAIFPIARDFFLRDAVLPTSLSLITLERALQADNFSPVSDPSKSKIEFRKARSVWKVLQMEKPVYSKISEYQQQQKFRQRLQSPRALLPVEDGWRIALEGSNSISIRCEA